MEANEGSTDWGTLTPAEDRGQPSLLVRAGWSAGDGTTAYYVWQPPADLKSQLPEGFHLPFRVHVGPDGLRRVAPVGSVEDYIAWAWLGGFAILCRHRQLDADHRQTYRMMWFVYQQVRRMRAHRRRSFKFWRDLFIARSGRSAIEQNSVIPTLVERENNKGVHVRPGVCELEGRGYEAARASGILHPNPRQVTHFGLVSYAQDDPLPLTDDEVPRLIRESLFEVDSSDSPSLDPEVVKIVYERSFDAIMNHTEDTATSFNKWFKDGKNSFVKQIAKQRRARGGELEKDLVRKAILQLGWDAYQYVADCLSIQMQAVANAIPEPLNAEERQIFSEMHLRQPHYGNLTLLLLGERLGFVESVVLDLCDRPSDRHLVAVLHRLLQFYAMMAPERRDVDREQKRKEVHEFDDGRDSPPSREPTRFARIAAHILDVRDEGCPCAAPEWDAVLKSEGDPITFGATCLRCDTRREVTLSRGEFIAIGEEVVHPDD